MPFKGTGLFFRPYSVHLLFLVFLSPSGFLGFLKNGWLCGIYGVAICSALLCSSSLLRVYFLPYFPLPLHFSPMKVRHNANQCLLFLCLWDRGQWVWDGDSLRISVLELPGMLCAWNWGWEASGEGACLQALFAQLTPFLIAPTESPAEGYRGYRCSGRCFLLTQSICIQLCKL